MSERKKPGGRFHADPEVLDLFAEEPELLAVVDAIAQTQLDGRRVASRRNSRHLLAAAAVMGAVLVLLLISPWQTGDLSLVDRAIAAVDGGRVLHLRAFQQRSDDVTVNLSTGNTTATGIEIEVWFDEVSGRVRTRTLRNGRVVADGVERGAPERTGDAGQRAPTLFASGYRAALGRGSAEAGETAEGKPSLNLQVAPGVNQRVVLDASTNLPLRFEPFDQPDVPAWTVRMIDARPFTANQFKPRSFGRLPVGGRVVASRVVGIESLRRDNVPWLGSAFGRFTLTQIERDELIQTFATGGDSPGTGYRLRYRASESSRNEIALRMSRRPEPAYGFVEGRLTSGFNPIPSADRVSLVRSGAGANERWLGQMRYAGYFITILARERSDVISAAQRLRPAR